MPPGGNPYVIELFTIILVLFGIGSFLYVMGVIAEYVVSGDMISKSNRKKMQKIISNLRDHYIICGAGRSGFYMMQELKATVRPFVVIEKSEERIREILTEFDDLLYVQGDATNDEIMEQAGLEHAAGIMVGLPDEKDNLCITMAARQLNSRIRIVAHTANVINTGKQFFKGGANSVVLPNFIGGLRLVSEMVRPHATEFLDEMMNHKNTRSEMAEIVMSKEFSFCGLSLNEAALPKKYGILIMAIRKRDERVYTYNPSGNSLIEHADTIVFFGTRDQIYELIKTG